MPDAPLSPRALCSLLQKSWSNADISTCRNLHNYIIHHGYLSDAYLPNYLIRMYALCGLLPDACDVFYRIVDPSVFSWSAIISACAAHALHEQAFGFYRELLKSNAQPDGHVYVAMLTVCTRKAHLDHGKLVHSHILAGPYKLDVYVNNTLIEMYAKCGSMCKAQQVFDALPCRDIVTWNTLIAGYVQNKSLQEALLLFGEIQNTDIRLNPITFVCALKACASMPAVVYGMIIHSLAVEHGLELVVQVNNVLIDVYAKCGSLGDAEMLFVKSCKQDVVTWTSIISGYVSHGLGEKAIDLYEMMQTKCIEPNVMTYASILKACSTLAAVDLGRLIHAIIIEKDLRSSIVINNALIGMYASCGGHHDAKRVFEQSSERDVVTWNSIIDGCVEHGHLLFALQLFKQLQQEGLELDGLTLANTVRACSHLQNLHEGKVLHVHAFESDWHQSICVSNNLVHMYASCSSLDEARRVFDSMRQHDVVTWNTMIGGYVECGWGKEAFKLFDQMQHVALQPNPVTLVCMLKACSTTLALDKGRLLHAYILKNNVELDAYVGSILVNFYAMCGSVQDAHNVFSKLQNRSLVPWSAMIAGYAQNSNHEEALTCFKGMQEQGLELDDVVYVSLLSACSHAGVPYEGEFQFEYGCGIAPSLKLCNCLADLLGRAGHLNRAKTLLENMPFHPNMSSWNSLISHYRTHCYLELENC